MSPYLRIFVYVLSAIYFAAFTVFCIRASF
jgi:hypothetical protein